MRSLSVLLLAAVTALGLSGSAAKAEEISRLCEMDRAGMPLACFYVQKSDLRTIVRDYSTVGPLTKPATATQPQLGAPISFPGVE